MKTSYKKIYILGMIGILAITGQVLAEDLMTVKGYQHLKSDYQLVKDGYDQVPGTLITPHVKWALGKPYEQMRILVILPMEGTREAMELKERFPVEMVFIMTHAPESFGVPEKELAYYPGYRPEKLNQLALTRLSRPDPYDAILIGKMSWKAIPEPVQQLIMKRVLEGAGLVYVSPADMDERLTAAYNEKKLDADKAALTTGVPLKMLPLDDKERPLGPLEIRLGQIGQGRVMFLDYKDSVKLIGGTNHWEKKTILTPDVQSPLTPLVLDDDLYYEYYHSLLAKGILWASRKEPGMRLLEVKGDGVALARDALPASPVSFIFETGANKDAACTFHWELRNRENEVVLVQDSEAKIGSDGKFTVAPQVPRLAKGLYVLDVWVKKGGDVLGWGSANFTVSGDDLIALRLEKEAFPRSEPIRGTIQAARGLPPGARLQVELHDTYGRLVDQAQPGVENNEAKFAFLVKHPLARMYFVTASVLDKDGVVESKKVSVGLPDNTVDDYVFEMWANAGQGRVLRVEMEQVKRHGVNGYYECHAGWGCEKANRISSDNLARANFFAHLYTDNIGTGYWQKTIEEEKERYSGGLMKGKAFGRYGALLYSICEENQMSHANKDYENPKTLAEYREYMKKQFGSLEKMNSIWNSDYKSWDDLHMIELPEAKFKNRFPQYMSQELYKQDRFMISHEYLAQKVREGDPGARISIDISVGQDMDYGRLAEFVNGGWAIPEMYPFLMYRPGSVYGQDVSCNNEHEEFFKRYAPWKSLFQGGRLLFRFMILSESGIGGSDSFTPDMAEPLLCFEQSCQEVSKIQHGIGKLLIQSTKVKDPILVFYSNISALAGFLNNRETTWFESRAMFYNALDKVGLTYRAISGKELAALQYGPERKALFLPYCQAMNKAEVDSVKRFVEQGGLVIADFNPAIFDEYCRPYGKAEVLKAGEEKVCNQCGGKGSYEKAAVWQPCSKCGGAGKIVEGREVRYTGSALQEVFGQFEPMHLNSFGKGKALYLGKNLATGDLEGLALLLEKEAGVKRPFQVRNKADGPRYDSFTAAFENGKAKFFCLLGEKVTEAPDEDAFITLDKPYHVYDAVRQTYLGYTNMIQVGVVPAGAKVLAGLPCKVEDMKVEVKGKKTAPGKDMTVTAQISPKEIAGAGLCVRFDVLDPEGNRMEAYSRKVVSDTGVFELTIPLALNEKPGQYTVKAEEVVSGIKQQTEFTVQKK